jgi:hypothetical protein
VLPEDREIASYLFSEKVNYLAHVNVGKLQRAGIIFLLALSAVLSYIAAAVGLSDVSKFWGELRHACRRSYSYAGVVLGALGELA